ncbi:MAG: hypothetical protein ACLSFT_04735 [Ruminococcus callidus]
MPARSSGTDLAHFPVGIAAFIGAFFTGCVASIVKKKIGYPRFP